MKSRDMGTSPRMGRSALQNRCQVDEDGAVAVSERLAGPDRVKGFLMVAVVLGHTISAPLAEDPVKWLIYGFHMPAFLFLSGWMTSRGRLTQPGLARHYWRRMGWAWAVVSVAWLWWTGQTVGVRTLLLEPSFHLWFVPALALSVAVTAVWVRRGWPLPVLLAVAVVAAVAAAVVGDLGVDDRFLAYPVWFVLGAVRPATARPALVVGAGVAYLASFAVGPYWLAPLAFLLLNVAWLPLLPRVVERLSAGGSVVLDGLGVIGRYSLWIYLLHPFVTEELHGLSATVPAERVIGAAVVAAVLVGATAVGDRQPAQVMP